jgi:hypothetical protein
MFFLLWQFSVSLRQTGSNCHGASLQSTINYLADKPEKYSVDLQRLTQIRKNIFQSPSPLFPPKKPRFLSQPPLLQQLTAKRFFAFGFPYI